MTLKDVIDYLKYEGPVFYNNITFGKDCIKCKKKKKKNR